MKALIIVDYTNDFIASDGKLTCGKVGQDLDSNISELIKEFSKNQDFIFVANDCHEENDIYSPEHTLFPPHNIRNSHGAKVYGKTLETLENIDQTKVIYFDKTRYSAFAGTFLDIKLRERNITQIYLVGVCTDICILHTAIDAYNLNYEINVYEKGVASFNEEGHNFAISHLINSLNAKII